MSQRKNPKREKAGAGSESLADIIPEILTHIDHRFDQAGEDLKAVEQRLTVKLDQIQFLVAAQERRISALEDRMRVIATKLGLEFRAA